MPYLLIGITACLSGCAFFYLWRKQSSESSSTSSEAVESSLLDLEKWKRGTELELATLFDRVKSGLGRLDREKRKEKTSLEPQEGPPSDPGELDDQGKLNHLLARRFYGVGAK